MSITIVIHTHNEEQNIEECINSARLLSTDILVVDMDSTDSTKDKAISLGTAVTNFPFSQYVEPARAFGINQAQGEWVFILDADERITQELAEEIQTVLKGSTVHTYFRVPRKNIFGKKQWLQHGGWWPDNQIRFIKKTAFIEWPQQIHSTPRIDGSEGIFQTAMLHYFHGDITSMVDKTTIYENIESDLLFKANKPVTVATFFRKFLGELFRRLIKKQGYLDGTIGIIESVYQAYSKTITYLYLYEKKQNSSL